MRDELSVRYPFFRMRYRNYVRIQTAIVVSLLVAAMPCYLFLREHPYWWFANAWWILPIIAVLEVLESLVALRRAQRQASSAGADEPHS